VGPRADLDEREKRKFLTLPELELRPLGRLARRQSLYRLRYPSSLRNEAIITKMGLKKDTLQEIEQQLRWLGRVMRMVCCRIARRVAEWNPQGTRRAMDQSTHGRMELGTACKAETSGMKSVSIERSEGKKLYVFGFRKTEKFL
jgi:hypothetical protein